MLFLALPFLLVGTAIAGTFNVCPVNVNNEFFIVRQTLPPKALQPKDARQAFLGFSFSVAETACETFGYRLANLTINDLLSVRTMAEACGPVDAGFWFGTFEALPIPFDCFALFPGAVPVSDATICATQLNMAICEVPDDIVRRGRARTTTSVTDTVTSMTEVFTSTTTTTRVTDYMFTSVGATRTITNTETETRRHHHTSAAL